MSTPVVPDRSTESPESRAQHDRNVHILHMLQATAVPETVAGKEAEVPRDILSGILDVCVTPTVLADRHLNLVYANAAARALLAGGGALQVVAGRLAATPEFQPKLSNALSAATRSQDAQPPFILGASGPAPVAIWVQPLDALLHSSSLVWAHGLAMVVIKPLRCPPTT